MLSSYLSHLCLIRLENSFVGPSLFLGDKVKDRPDSQVRMKRVLKISKINILTPKKAFSTLNTDTSSWWTLFWLPIMKVAKVETEPGPGHLYQVIPGWCHWSGGSLPQKWPETELLPSPSPTKKRENSSIQGEWKWKVVCSPVFLLPLRPFKHWPPSHLATRINLCVKSHFFTFSRTWTCPRGSTFY